MQETGSTKSKEAFSCFAPTAGDVQLLGDFTGWEQRPIGMRKLKNGTWKTTVTLAPGSYEYRFKVDGQWRDDEGCPVRRPNVFGAENCVRDVQ